MSLTGENAKELANVASSPQRAERGRLRSQPIDHGGNKSIHRGKFEAASDVSQCSWTHHRTNSSRESSTINSAAVAPWRSRLSETSKPSLAPTALRN